MHKLIGVILINVLMIWNYLCVARVDSSVPIQTSVTLIFLSLLIAAHRSMLNDHQRQHLSTRRKQSKHYPPVATEIRK